MWSFSSYVRHDVRDNVCIDVEGDFVSQKNLIAKWSGDVEDHLYTQPQRMRQQMHQLPYKI